MKALSLIRRAVDGITLGTECLVGAILAAQVVLLVYSAAQGIASMSGSALPQVLWLTEVVEYGLVPVGFLGAAIALRLRAHQGIDAAVRLLPQRARAALDVAGWILIAGFGVFFAYAGGLYVLENLRSGGTLASVAIPKWLFYLSYPIAGGLFAMFSLARLLDRAFPPPEGRPSGADGPAEGGRAADSAGQGDAP